MWSTSDWITNLTFFDDLNSNTPTKAFVDDAVDDAVDAVELRKYR